MIEMLISLVSLNPKLAGMSYQKINVWQSACADGGKTVSGVYHTIAPKQTNHHTNPVEQACFV